MFFFSLFPPPPHLVLLAPCVHPCMYTLLFVHASFKALYQSCAISNRYLRRLLRFSFPFSSFVSFNVQNPRALALDRTFRPVSMNSPAMGAYIALHHGNEAVFLCSVLLIGIDLVFIAMYLPESLGAGQEFEEDAGGVRKEPSRKVVPSSSSGYGGDALGAFQVG